MVNVLLVSEVSIQNSKGYIGVLVLYIGLWAKMFLNLKIFSTSWESYATSCNSLFTIILCNFTARSSVQWTRDKTKIEGTQLKSLKNMHVFHKLKSKPTHLLPQTSSCIDLIYTDWQNLIDPFHFVKGKINWKNQICTI